MKFLHPDDASETLFPYTYDIRNQPQDNIAQMLKRVDKLNIYDPNNFDLTIHLSSPR